MTKILVGSILAIVIGGYAFRHWWNAGDDENVWEWMR
jgi:hypothetical protein